MKNYNKNLKIFMCIFLSLFAMSFVLAANAVTLLPAANAELSGAVLLNGTLDTNTVNITSATFYYRIDNGGTPTAWVLIATVSNVTETLFNYSFDTTFVVDTINMTFNISVSNESAVIDSDSNINISIDNGNPTATWSSTSLATNINVDPSTSFIIGVDADDTIGIESCLAFFDSATASVAASNEACSASFTCNSFSVDANHNPTFLVQVTDDNGDATNTSSRTVTCRGVGGGYLPEDFPNGDTDGSVDKLVSVTEIKEDNFVTRFWNWLKSLF